MRVKPEIAAVTLFACVGVSLAIGLLVGVAATRATTRERTPSCNCPATTITT